MSQKDIAVLSQGRAGKTDGVNGLLEAFKHGTAEMRNLLTNETDVVFECRVCRSLFRDHITLISHKRDFCKTKFTAVTANAAALWEEFLQSQAQVGHARRDRDEEEKEKRLRNPIKIINKRVQDVIVPVPGSSEVLHIPTLPRIGSEENAGLRLVGLAAAQTSDQPVIPDRRVAISLSLDPNNRGRTNKFRSKMDQLLAVATAPLSPLELAALHKIITYNLPLLEGGNLKCDHANCRDLKAFKNYSVFAYHCGMKHSSRQEDGLIACYLCNHSTRQWSKYHQHYLKVHKGVKEQHENGYGAGTSRKANKIRSLSPDLSGEEMDKRDGYQARNEDARNESAPPVIEPIKPIVEQEEDMDEAPPVLTRMSRTRSRNLRSTAVEQSPAPAPSKSKEPSRSLTPISFPNESLTEPEDAQRQEKKEVRRVMTAMLNKVEEVMGERADVSGVRLVGRKRKLRGRAAFLEKQKVLKRQMEEEAENVKEDEQEQEQEQEPEVEQGVETEAEHEDEHEAGELNLDSVEEEVPKKRRRRKTYDTLVEGPNELSAPRPSRAKKRPDWMENYHVEGEKGKMKREEDGNEIAGGLNTPPVTPQKENTPVVKVEDDSPPVLEAAVAVPRPRGRPPGSKKKRSMPAATRTQSPMVEVKKEEPVLPTPNATPSPNEPVPVASPGASRRKQDMSVVRDNSDTAPKFKNLADIPVKLSDPQKQILFSGLKPVPGESTYSCMYCNTKMNTLKDGRRHMVSHIRVIRLRCKLCCCGAFFCHDMRAHLVHGDCPGLPSVGIVPKNNCVSLQDADQYAECVIQDQEGRCQLTNYMIVDCYNRKPHFPNLEIEEKMLNSHENYSDVFPMSPPPKHAFRP